MVERHAGLRATHCCRTCIRRVCCIAAKVRRWSRASPRHWAAAPLIRPDLLANYGLDEWATVLAAPLVKLEDGSRWYSQASMPVNPPLADLLIVDGPPTSVGALARYPALPRLAPRLAPGYAIFVGDADRDDQREMVRRWCLEHPGLTETRIQSEKGLAILRQNRLAS